MEEMPASVQRYGTQLEGRSMLVRKLRILPIEAIVRGYLTGSAWSEYRRQGTVHGIPVAPGMRESDRFPHPLFTPSTKADQGDHDENIHPSRVADIIGPALAARMATLAVDLYVAARDFALTKGIIIADTKFEFGVTGDGDEASLVLVDEVLTPDSSRFWPAATYRPGQAQASFDKQYLRDYLTSHAIDKKEGVEVPPEVVTGTRDKYIQVLQLLTGTTWKP
ncbi:protein of unknown function [Taphrina deformans PYCC 5710]|uniref:Phosphoribosylaminoimidazole-succinocarboxamide synthase n=1 Tax=Taphrina deformans (strain PYCC 5710 / ATCC 11124 / CBS 356.35 / IMI 108563 / JCM 9778 / NBRC 8474) TaxID=1097556 RepID=R4XH09_TAPDE|nr:protein of unknown function [Taphrina deformans PYCC 5710]|eukprot:CCG85081.1 protein of unknown function [Taphrina deformans PYCC 5710]